MLTFTFTMDLKADDHNSAVALADALVKAARGVARNGLTVGTVEDNGRIVASWEVTGTAAPPKCDWCGGALVKPVKSKSGALTFCTAACRADLDIAPVTMGGAK